MKRAGAQTMAAGFARAARLLEAGKRDEAIAMARSVHRLAIAVSNSGGRCRHHGDPGHDGTPQDLRPHRDRAEWDKKREPVPDFNINTDRLEWLFEHGHIDGFQRDAGLKLQKDWYLSEIIKYASAGGSVGGAAKSTLPDAKLMAMVRFGGAISAVMLAPCTSDPQRRPLAFRGEQVLRFMILEHDWSMERMAKYWQVRKGLVKPIMLDALNALVAFYKVGGKKGGNTRPIQPYHPFHGEG